MKDVQGEAINRFLKSPEGAEYAKILAEEDAKSASKDAQNAGSFKSPEGFSNVVGVGANPVLDTMNEQLVQLKVMSDFLAEIARPSGGGVPVDFTKTETPTLK